MQKVGIVCDSNCDLPEDVIKQYDIRIVPGRIIFGDNEVRRHYVDITYEEFYNRLVNEKEMPKTSVPSPKEYQQVYEEALKNCEEIIVLCTSSKLSSMYNIANMVASQYFPDKVTVIDSNTITISMGLIVLEAAKKAQAGTTKDELVAYIKDYLLPNSRTFGGIPTLTYLQKGGRIGKVSSIMGNLLHVKPIINIENGELIPLGKVRGMENVYKLMYDFAKKLFKEQTLEKIVIGHTANEETALKLANEIKALPNSPKEIQVIEFGPSVGTHLGPGGLSLSWVGDFKKELLSL